MRLPALLLAATALAGCAAVGPNYVRPEAPATPAFRNMPAEAPPPPVKWWTGFGDPAINRLVDLALAQNLDVAQAVARVDQARAAARFAGAALRPAGQLDLQAARVRQSALGTNPFAAQNQDIDFFSAQGSASWEIDVFGGLRRGREAAFADLGAAEAAVGAARLLVAGDVVDAVLQLRGFQSRIALAERRVADNARFEEIVRASFEGGHVARLQLDQAQSTTAQARAALPLLRAGAEAQRNRLAVLTGRPPEADLLAETGVRPIPDPLPAPGGLTPADLLTRRPDVVAAERRLAAANARIGVATADYYPRISLQGLLGPQALDLGDLFTGEALAGQLAAGLRWRLFDFGRVDANIARNRGVYAEQLAAYRQTLLRAVEDVENAFVTLAERAQQVRDLQAASAALERAKDAAQAGFDAGAVRLLDVIDAQRQLLVTQDLLADAVAQRARAAVALHRALGGAV